VVAEADTADEGLLVVHEGIAEHVVLEQAVGLALQLEVLLRVHARRQLRSLVLQVLKGLLVLGRVDGLRSISHLLLRSKRLGVLLTGLRIVTGRRVHAVFGLATLNIVQP